MCRAVSQGLHDFSKYYIFTDLMCVEIRIEQKACAQPDNSAAELVIERGSTLQQAVEESEIQLVEQVTLSRQR